MRHSFIRTIIGILEPGFPILRKRSIVHGKPMILRSDITPICFSIYARYVLPTVPVGEFVSLGARREGEELIAETHAEDGLTDCHCLFDVFDGRLAHSRA